MSPLVRCRPLQVLAWLVLVLGLSSAAGAQSKAGPLVLAITQTGKATLAGETQFVVELRNAGVVAVTLPARPGWDTEGGLELRVMPAGAATTARTAATTPDPARNPRLTGSRRGVALASGEALGLYRTVTTLELFPSTGEYDVVVAYRGLGGGEVVSAPLRVSVVP